MKSRGERSLRRSHNSRFEVRRRHTFRFGRQRLQHTTDGTQGHASVKEILTTPTVDTHNTATWLGETKIWAVTYAAQAGRPTWSERQVTYRRLQLFSVLSRQHTFAHPTTAELVAAYRKQSPQHQTPGVFQKGRLEMVSSWSWRKTPRPCLMYGLLREK